ncbi:MAG TPA: AbrB family transcriptional regulator [Lentisphaeria bacterium]|nr:MAG: AbrB family transcriptional regulator [Lentisphaerae bacterium GWF2_38_69]HBM15407.1 AbrB family transcriptional regulator [Lentisphaeria bacterium]
MNTVTVSPKYQIVIPAEIRHKAKIQRGQKIQLINFDGRIELMPLKKASEMRGFLKGINTKIEREDDRFLAFNSR